MRKLKELKLKSCSAKIYHSAEREEYVVKFSPLPRRMKKYPDYTYDTDSMDDAYETAVNVLREMRLDKLCG